MAVAAFGLSLAATLGIAADSYVIDPTGWVQFSTTHGPYAWGIGSDSPRFFRKAVGRSQRGSEK